MIAPEARASSTSDSVIAPTPRCTTSTFTSAVESCANASASASAGPPWSALMMIRKVATPPAAASAMKSRSEEHTSELQSLAYLVCRLLLEKKKNSQLRDGSLFMADRPKDSKRYRRIREEDVR